MQIIEFYVTGYIFKLLSLFWLCSNGTICRVHGTSIFL